jgi:Fur family ferric uptake transcriptional regulator
VIRMSTTGAIGTAARERRLATLKRNVAVSLHAMLNAVRAHGLRVSDARRRVLVTLLAAERPLTAEQIACGRDVASVYRNLEALESIGLVQHVHPGHGPGRYVLTCTGGWASCETCGDAVRLDPATVERIRRAVLDATGFDAPFTHFPVVGLCPDCKELCDVPS